MSLFPKKVEYPLKPLCIMHYKDIHIIFLMPYTEGFKLSVTKMF